MTRARTATFAIALLSALSCREREVEDLSVGEVVVVVDTDMPVPAFVARLHVDLYDEKGTWYATRDVERGRPSDWPASFGIHVTEAEGEKLVVLRLRAYPERATRDYRGERFQPRATATAGPEALVAVPLPNPTDRPRLVDERGEDVTPRFEPQPLLAIDRLAKVRVRTGRRATARIVLRGACVGTMADLAASRTCTDTEGVLVPVTEMALEDDRTPRPSLVGSFDPRGGCTIAPRPPSRTPEGTPLFDEEVCVPGAMFRFGTPDGVFGEADALPERIAIVAPFLLDRYEVTVARYREALARGFVPPDEGPVVNDGPFPSKGITGVEDTACTYTSTPSGRETHPLSCVSWETARALCAFDGGDLPTEVQWEYAAVAAARPFRTRFPWGGPDDEVPTCARAVWGRADRQYSGQLCFAEGVGPMPVDARSGPGGDVTPGLGIIGLGGNLGELVRDAFAPLTAACWASQPLHDPACDVPSTIGHSLRGGSWHDNAAALLPGERRREFTRAPGSGFRCMRPGAGAAR